MTNWLPEEAVSLAFDWLREASEVVAAAKINVSRKEFRAKKVYAKLFRVADGNIEARKAWAMDHPDYEAAMEEYFEAAEIWEQMQDRRNKCEACLEAWRTQEASQRGLIRSSR
jgi:enterochelin esterase-like enzyme